MGAEPTAARGPSDELRRAAAFVFVTDLDAPEPDDADAHHLADVLRLRAGEVVAVGDGRGRWRLCKLVRPGTRRAVGLEIAGVPVVTPPVGDPVTVGFALLKGDRPDWTVQKLTECGVDRIIPLLSERTVVRLDADARRRRGARLRRVAREAAAQSRRAHLPEVSDPLPLVDALDGLPAETTALAEPGAAPLSTAVRALLVGPEGGWSPGELAAAPALVGFGPLVLRGETAAVVAGVLLATARGSFALGGHGE